MQIIYVNQFIQQITLLSFNLHKKKGERCVEWKGNRRGSLLCIGKEKKVHKKSIKREKKRRQKGEGRRERRSFK